MLRAEINKSELYDPQRFAMVSQVTRQAIVEAIETEMAKLEQSIDPNFNPDDLYEALESILNQDPASSQSDSSGNVNPVIVRPPSLPLFVTCNLQGQGEASAVIAACCVLFSCCFCCINGVSLYASTMSRDEARVAKMLKAALVPIMSLAAGVALFFTLSKTVTKDEPDLTAYFLFGILATLAAATTCFATSLASYAIPCKQRSSERQPSEELIEQFGAIVTLLRKVPHQPSDDVQACVEFTKEVLRLYLANLSQNKSAAATPGNTVVAMFGSNNVPKKQPTETSQLLADNKKLVPFNLYDAL